MFETIENTPGSVTVVGRTATERRLSALNGATDAATAALSAAGGKVGKAAARATAMHGLAKIALAASHNDYRPVAEYIAARTGSAACVSNRASFESLPDRFEEAVQAAKMGKNGGYTADKKTGAMKPGAKLALALELKAIATELVAAAAKMREERMAAKRAIEA